MRQSFWNKRIPTLAGLLLIGVGISMATFLSQRSLPFFSQASPSDSPQHVQISNITESSFTVTYTTDANVIGSLSYGLDKNIPQVALDDRDQANGTPLFHTVHSITVKQVKPKTTYFFSVKSGTNTYLNNDVLFQVLTAANSNAPPQNEKPLTGKVITETGNPTGEVLVFAKTTNSQLLSTLVKPTGFFLLPLDTLRDASLTSFVQLNDGTSMDIAVVSVAGSSHTMFSLGGDNTIPAITLSQNYDFTNKTTPVASESSQSVSFSLLQSSMSAQTTPAILAPQNNEGLVDSQPEFKGTAPPDTEVNIEIHSVPIKTKVTADSGGFWTFRPSVPLAPGLHTIIITFKDPSGILKTMQQSFTVFAAGSQVNQSATPSATPIITISPTIVISPTLSNPTPSLTGVPISSPTPTSEAAPTPTIAASEQPTITISTNPTPTLLTFGTGTQINSSPTQTPRLITGDASSPWIGILGIATVITGMILFFATQGSSL